MNINNVSVAVENLKRLFQKKSDTEIADLLNIPRTSLSTIKSRNATGTMFEKIECIEDNVSIDAIFLSKDDQEVDCFSLANKAILVARNDPLKLQELSDFLENFVILNNNLKVILPLIQTIKGKNFITILSEMWTGNGERMLVVLSRFLSYLKTNPVAIKHPKQDFIDALKQFDISLNNNSSIWNFLDSKIISEEDRKKLINWVENNLDDVSCYDIIASNSVILEAVDNELNIFNGYIRKKIGFLPKSFYAN